MDIGYRIELQADRMPGTTEATAFTDSYKHMWWNEVTEFSDFVYPCNAGVPQLVYANKTGDCLFIYLSIYLFAYGRPNRKA